MNLKKIVKFSMPGLLLFVFSFSLAQSNFDPATLFAPFTQNTVTKYRSANGAPGPDYWQNKVNYKIDASIDTNTNILSGLVRIEYINNSPDHLNSLWLQLDQNLYQPNSLGNFSRGLTSTQFTNGYEFKNITIQTGNNTTKADYIIAGTRMQIRLHQPLKPAEKCLITIDYYYEIPGLFGGRTDWFQSQNGKIYEIAQWYPRMCVYDDLNGWNTLPYIGTGEFYCEYGDFDYKITVPKGMLVVGSGELVNEKEMYTPNQLTRLQQAKNSDKTILIRTKEEVNKETAEWRKNRSKKIETATWHFKMTNTRDVAFGASAAYILDAARINLPDGKKAMAMSAYPVESFGEDAWSRSTEFLKGTIEHFSEKWVPYPYPYAINIAGNAGGMEYPGIVFDGMRAKAKTLFWVTAHEIGHTWFPMMVGSNERLHAWMDEGLNTFIDVYASDAFNKGEFAPKRDGEYAPKGGNPADEILPWIEDPKSPSMMSRADMLTGKYRHPSTYFKPAFGLIMLREVILGEDRFDYAFKAYINRWSYKHPSPDDFFRTMENESGEDLSYFWRQWFQHNWKFDMSIDSVISTPEKGYSTILLKNNEKSVYPVKVKISYVDGKSETLTIPVEVWYSGDKYQFRVNHQTSIQSVIIDPENKLPDSNRTNNRWQK